MIEPRLYRVAFVPALLVFVFAMFSLQERPPPLAQGLAADVVFEGDTAVDVTRRLARRHADRRVGTPGDAAVAAEVASDFRARGFETEVDRFTEGGVELVNVTGRRTGTSPSQILVLAGRDADAVPDVAGSAADTAALMEMARVLGGRALRKTLVLASVDGSALGHAGARRLAASLGGGEPVDAVLVLSELGAASKAPPALVQWSGDDSRGSVGLARTAAASVSRELGSSGGTGSVASQIVRLALPLGLGAQGVLLERDLEAIRFAGDGELPRNEAGLDGERFGALGSAVLRTLSAIDRLGRPDPGPDSYIGGSRKLLAGSTLSALVLALLFPALAAAIDGFARARRRRERVGPWSLWALLSALPFVAGLAAAELLVLIGQAPDAPPAPLLPSAEPLETAGWAALGVTTAVMALAWVFGRPLVLRRMPPPTPVRRRRSDGGAQDEPESVDPSSAGAGAALALVLALTVFAVWLRNPFMALLLLPGLHLWTLLSLTDVAGRLRWALALVLGGLVLPVLSAVFYLDVLSLDPLEGSWYLFLLVTGHHVGVVTALVSCLLLGLFGCVVAVAVAKVRREAGVEEKKPATRGPASYAGPGSLGGTESALRR